MRHAAILAAALALAGCGFTPEGDIVRSAVKERGAQAYDEGIANSLWFICNAASVGSVRRNFAKSMDAYNALCAEPPLDLRSPVQ